jgi:hypothetical protein
VSSDRISQPRLAAPPDVRLPFDLVRVHGDLAYVSGHGPFDGDRLLIAGRVGAEVSVRAGLRRGARDGLVDPCLAQAILETSAA